MSTATAPQKPGLNDVAPPKLPWIQLAWFGGLLVLCYLPVLHRLFTQWMTDDDMGHGVFVPMVAAYIVWQKRDEILSLPVKTSWFGLALILWSSFQLLIGTLGSELFLQRTAFVFALIGLIWLLCGTEIVKALKFPLFLLFFMVPIPAIIFNQITLPLQFFASSVAEQTLMFIGIPVLREGNILMLPSQTLSVVEACSGIRSLLSLTFLSLVYGWFFESRDWVRVVLLFSSVPVAIIANAGRVTLTGVVGEYNPELAEGVFHTAEGWLIFLVSLAILVAFHGLLSKTLALAGRRN